MKKRIKNFLDEFKNFATRGNVVDLAVGVAVGGAFTKIVSSLVNDIIMPLVSKVSGGTNFREWAFNLNFRGGKPLMLNYGMFIQNVFDFLIVAFFVFILVKVMNKLALKRSIDEKLNEKVDEPIKKSEETILLEEIRDILKSEKIKSEKEKSEE